MPVYLDHGVAKPHPGGIFNGNILQDRGGWVEAAGAEGVVNFFTNRARLVEGCIVRNYLSVSGFLITEAYFKPRSSR